MILVTEKRLLRRGYTFAQVLIEIVYYSSQKIMIKYSSSSRKSSTDIPIKNITNLLNQPLNYLSPRHLPIAPSFKPIQAQKHYRNSNIQIPRAPKTARARNENYQQLTQTGFKSINCTPQKSKEKKNNSFTGVILQKKDKSDYQNESKENLNLNSNLVMNNSHRALQQLTNSTILRQNPKEDKKKLLRETLSSNGLWNPHKNCLPPKPYQVSPFASMHSDNKKRSGQLQRKDKYPSEIDQIEKIQFKTHSRKNSRTQQQRLFFRQSPLHQSKVTQNKYTTKNSPAKVEVARSRSKRQRTTSQVILPIAGKYSSSLNSSRRASLNNSQLKIQDFDLGPCKGEGRFGKFYPALHKKTGYLMGIKQVKKEDVRIMLDQFILEIKICMYLNHPNIVKVYAFFSDKTYFYILMEYMEEGTLYKAIKSSKKLSEENACVKLYQICDAVSYLHSNDILHRDIKPQNIVMSNGVCKLCDFGWATSSKERRKTYCGTLDYVCPQILEGQSYDNFVDIWAIGVLAYEMLTGKAPFYHISRKQTMKSIMNCDFSLPLQLSIEAKMFIRKALQKNPDQRITIEYLTHDKFVMQGCHKL